MTIAFWILLSIGLAGGAWIGVGILSTQGSTYSGGIGDMLMAYVYVIPGALVICVGVLGLVVLGIIKAVSFFVG